MEVHCTGREVDSRQLKVERIRKKKNKDNAETLGTQRERGEFGEEFRKGEGIRKEGQPGWAVPA
jgi:hypothetical protein